MKQITIPETMAENGRRFGSTAAAQADAPCEFVRNSSLSVKYKAIPSIFSSSLNILLASMKKKTESCLLSSKSIENEFKIRYEKKECDKKKCSGRDGEA